MNTANRSETLQFIRARREEIADGWYRAIVLTDFTALTAAEVRRCLAELSDRAVDLLFSEPFERREARELGSALAGMHYLSPEALRGTQEELARRLLEGLGRDQIVALQPRLAALLSELAAGFTKTARDQVLTEQEVTMPFVWGTMLMVGFPVSTDTLRHAVTVLTANPLIARCSVEIV